MTTGPPPKLQQGLKGSEGERVKKSVRRSFVARSGQHAPTHMIVPPMTMFVKKSSARGGLSSCDRTTMIVTR